MWARIVEFMLSCFLALSPFFFHYKKEPQFFWYNDFIVAFLIAVFSLASYVRRFDKIHLLICPLALWLILVAFQMREVPISPGGQSYIVLGLLLGMTAFIPSHTHRPPKEWVDFERKKVKPSKRA